MVMRLGLSIVGFLLFVGLLLVLPLALDRFQTPPPEQRRTKVLNRNLAEDVRIAKRGLYGVDVVRCGKCRMEKRRKGLLTFGGLNILVLENLRVVLPEDHGLEASEKESAAEDGAEAGSPKRTLAALGLSDSFLKAQGAAPRFSGVRIEGLEVCRLEGTNIVTIFTAVRGKAVREGLRLEGCDVRRDGMPERVGGALLQVKPRFRLSWDGGSLNL